MYIVRLLLNNVMSYSKLISLDLFKPYTSLCLILQSLKYLLFEIHLIFSDININIYNIQKCSLN